MIRINRIGGINVGYTQRKQIKTKIQKVTTHIESKICKFYDKQQTFGSIGLSNMYLGIDRYTHGAIGKSICKYTLRTNEKRHTH